MKEPRRRLFAAATVIGVLAGGVSLAAATPVAAAPPPVASANGPEHVVVGDWDGDGVDTIATVHDDGTWTVYDRWETPTRFVYGDGTGTPVVGDWDGDGRDGIGVVNARVFRLRQTPSSGPPQLTITYGLPADLPLVGDWNGDGRDELAIRRGQHNYLRFSLTNGNAHETVAYGRHSDIPVVGDWDGDGTDHIAVIRDTTWFVRNDHTSRTAPTEFRYGAATDAPLPGDWGGRGGDSPGVVRGSHLLTRNPLNGGDSTGQQIPWKASSTLSPCPYNDVVGDDPSLFVVAPNVSEHVPRSVASADAQQSLRNGVRYLLGTRFDARWFGRNSMDWIDIRSMSGAGFGGAEYSFRNASMSAMTVSTLLATGDFDAAHTRGGRELASEYVRRLTRSNACQHAANWSQGWPNEVREPGATWQSAMWMRSTASAAWLIWDDLSPIEQRLIARAVVWEADRLTAETAPVWFTGTGSARVGNTGAEDAAWDAALLHLATAMMPDHPSAADWRGAAVRYTLTATARVSDLARGDVVNGRSIADWIDGANLHDNGLLDNHMRHGSAEYQTALFDAWQGAVVLPLAGHPVPTALPVNFAPLYGALFDVDFVAGDRHDLDPGDGVVLSAPFASPGGPLISADGAIYSPNGYSWGGVDFGRYTQLHAMAQLLDPSDRAAQALAQHLAGVQQVQSRSTDGRSFLTYAEFPYQSAEEYNAETLAWTWLTLMVAESEILVFDDSPH